MKILHLSDLHRVEFDILSCDVQTDWIESLLKKYDPDIVVITGDIFEFNNYVTDIANKTYNFNPYEVLSRLFEDYTVICTLGNHEFCTLRVKEVLKYFNDTYNPKQWDVHYLDIIDTITIDNCTFLGNVLWYDGSMSTVPNQNIDSFADGRWLDRTILDFDWRAENKKCVKQILDVNVEKKNKKILCTHGVPHKFLNGHITEDDYINSNDPFNAYSGMNNLLELVHPDISLSGHTHLRRVLEIDGCECYNCGNDYRPPFQHCIIEI